MAITSKTCSHCGRSVPLYLKAGDTCPYCRVPFAYEVGAQRPPLGLGRSLILLLLAALLVAPLFLRACGTPKAPTSQNGMQVPAP